tara:strand:- start:4768 stop:5577 length:810 start_codon:yes stop_codon:yes gene_type:complete
MSNITFIGSGNMASAIFSGLINTGYDAKQITATGRDEKKLHVHQTKLGINITTDNIAAAQHADVIVLAVKPNMMQTVCETLHDVIQSNKPLVISVAAGTTEAVIQQWLGGNVPIIRCMPNTPVQIGAGASGLFANPFVSAEQKQIANDMMAAIGITVWVDSDADIDKVAAISGSGPAYFFFVMEAMQQAGEKIGLPRDTARQLTLQTALGAARMATQSDDSPAELRRKVTSPGGTTEAAINTMQAEGLESIFANAIQAAVRRAEALATE